MHYRMFSRDVSFGVVLVIVISSDPVALLAAGAVNLINSDSELIKFENGSWLSLISEPHLGQYHHRSQREGNIQLNGGF